MEGINWHWIFWLNVPIGLVLLPLGWLRLAESRGPADKLDLPGLVLVSTGLLAVVWAVIKGNELGWTSPTIVGFMAWADRWSSWASVLGAPLERPMLPLTFFRSRSFSLANGSSFLMTSGCSGPSSC